MKKWQCIVCGWIYDEAEGYEDEGIAPGTAWEDVPDDFVCPECGVGKEDFEMIEVGCTGESVLEATRPDATRSDATRSDATRSDATRSDA